MAHLSGNRDMERERSLSNREDMKQQPISEEALRLSIELITKGLQLTNKDRLLELCCGNGLMTKHLAPLVDQVYAVDFVERLIEHARKFRSAPNIQYVCADALGYLEQLLKSGLYVPSKVLLGDAWDTLSRRCWATCLPG